MSELFWIGAALIVAAAAGGLAAGYVIGFAKGFRRGWREGDAAHDFDRCERCNELLTTREEFERDLLSERPWQPGELELVQAEIDWALTHCPHCGERIASVGHNRQGGP